MNKNIIEYKDLIAFHPGAYIEEIIEDLATTPADFAQQVGISAKLMNKIITGKADITDNIADKLAKQTGISKQSWINIQHSYNVKIKQIKKSDCLISTDNKKKKHD